MISRTVDLGGPVHLIEYPGPERGPTFVCVHGLGGSHVNWMGLAPLLAERGRVLVPDLVGFGRTPLGSRSASLLDNRRLLDRFIRDVVGGPVILVGNSMGGLLSLLQAYEKPDTVAGLVLIAPALPRAPRTGVDGTVAAFFAAYMVPAVGETLINARMRRLGPERVSWETLKLCAADPGAVSEELLAAHVRMARERAQQPWATRAFLQAARSIVRILARRPAMLQRIAAVSAPTLVLAGRRDRLVPIAAVEAVARERADWDTVIWDDLGHIPMIEDPPRVAEAIGRWMEGPASLVLRACFG